MSIDELTFSNLPEVEKYVNQMVRGSKVTCNLQLKSPMLLVVITRPKDVQKTPLEYEFISEKILSVFNKIPSTKTILIKSAQFYARVNGEAPEWRMVKPILYIPELEEKQPQESKEVLNQNLPPSQQQSKSSPNHLVKNSNHNETKAYQSLNVYQSLNLRVQLLGRGITNEILSLYINGKSVANKFKTLHDCLNHLGLQGFYIVACSIETEGTYTHFYTLQRKLVLHSIPDVPDIFDELEQINNGVSLDDSIRSLFEGGARFW
ncbi:MULTISPECIES: hypothetical protein [Cyanophyceae]|uniref:hypothetical protein n=1 Tax=Cyanophyceae TaxID=3028117 RepID=UPI000C07F08B|nr:MULTISPECIES: hypothetical protein [Cyanophyceae]QCS48822.1 hypothetical protein FEK30_04875 [Picosynechococcus sp. PCC 11901]